MSNAPSPLDLFSRFSIAAERNKGIRLTPEDVDLMVCMGAFDAMSSAAAKYVREVAEARIAAREEARRADAEATQTLLRSKGRREVSSETAEEAMRRARSRAKPSGNNK